MARVFHAELWGPREGKEGQGGKYGWLFEKDVEKTPWQELQPTSPFYLFVPQDTGLRAEYEKGWKITDIFPVNSAGVVTGQDLRTISFSRPDAEGLARAAGVDTSSTSPILYRPFDQRVIIYDDSLVTRPRREVMRHMLTGENLALIATRQTRDQWDVFVTRSIIAHKSCSAYDINSLFPLYVYPQEASLKSDRAPNLSSAYLSEFEGRVGTEKRVGSEELLKYIYAIFHCSTYRARYGEFLKSDFPRVPLTSNRDLFSALCEKGGELVALHLLESPLLNNVITRFPVPGDHIVAKGYPKYVQPGRVHINADQYFEGIPENVWFFHVGGYQVAEKWLKDRRGRQLSYDDLTHYQKTITALHHTIRIMKEIDALIPKWPME